MWASRHEGLVSQDGVAPHVCDPLLVPHGWAVLERGNPWGSAGDAGLDTAAQARRLRVLLMAVWCPCRRPSMGRQVPHAFMRNALLDLTTILPATPYHQRNDVEAYSRYNPRKLFGFLQNGQGRYVVNGTA